MNPAEQCGETERGAPQAARRGHVLVVHACDGTWRSFPLADGTMTIGRDDDVDVRLFDPLVSRRHARLDIDGARFHLTDLASANGTQAGPHLLHDGAAAVRPGMPIMIGNSVLVIHAPSAAEKTGVVVDRSMQTIDDLVSRVAPTLINVLVLGETGVGKDVLAERIHRRSTRANGPLLRLNCAGLSSTLLESELFGHERGAFTGAQQTKPGLLEVAAGGTVFLDEIGEMPLDVQAKLLLAIEQRVIRRVGAVQPTRIDVRFVCATHRDLADEVKRDRFRSDFYYRINGLTIRIPPLRERIDEIEGLVAQFVRDAGERIGTQHVPAFEPEALACLREHSWPGNIRELRNLVERVLVLSDGEDITVTKLRAAGLPGSDMPGEPDCERARVLAVLADCGGNQSRAARRLGISRNTLIARIQQFGIARPRGLVE